MLFNDSLGLGCYPSHNATTWLPGASLSIASPLVSIIPLPADTGSALNLLVLGIKSEAAQRAFLYVALLASPFVLFYLATWAAFVAQRSSKDAVKTPPTVPYMIPVVGSAIGFGLNPSKFFQSISRWTDNQSAYCLKLLGQNLYFIYGPENVNRIWKYKTNITSPAVHAFVIDSVFGMRKKAVEAYTIDDSGLHSTPDPRSNVAPHNRIDHFTHTAFTKYFSGDYLARLYKRWSQDLDARLEALDIGDEWTQGSDIMDYWTLPLIAALNRALAGPLPEALDPNFNKDFLRFLTFVHPLMKGLPRWCAPEAYRLRDRLTHTVRQWQSVARACFRESDVDADGDADPWWGSRIFRERQKFLLKIDNWDEEVVASSDFGLLWGANLNAQRAAVWTIIEIFNDKTLLPRVRAELEEANFVSSRDIDKLLSLPLLQSIYAEVMRLRTEVQHVLYSKNDDIQINEWRFPKQHIVLVPAGAAHRNEDFWNTMDGQHPLNRFWADRFLVYPNDPRSGPMKKATKVPTLETADRGTPKYKESGLSDAFIPYGVGERACPGRFFARREVIAFCATIVANYDVELLTTERHFENGPEFYGLGTTGSLKSIPFRVRRRSKIGGGLP